MAFEMGKEWWDTQSKIDHQEIEDFWKLKKVLYTLIPHKIEDLVRRERFHHTDALLTATTKTYTQTYTIEIKTTYKTYYLTDGFLLRKDKFNNIMQDTAKRGGTERPVIFYFAEKTGQYAVFNLNKIDEHTRQGTKMLHKVEFDEDSPIVPTEVYFLDLKDAEVTGFYD